MVLNVGTAGAEMPDWPCHDEVLSKEDEALIEEFARELPVALGLPPARVILVFDSDRKAIYAGKTRAETRKNGRRGRCGPMTASRRSPPGMACT